MAPTTVRAMSSGIKVWRESPRAAGAGNTKSTFCLHEQPGPERWPLLARGPRRESSRPPCRLPASSLSILCFQPGKHLYWQPPNPQCCRRWDSPPHAPCWESSSPPGLILPPPFLPFPCPQTCYLGCSKGANPLPPTPNMKSQSPPTACYSAAQPISASVWHRSCRKETSPSLAASVSSRRRTQGRQPHPAQSASLGGE